MKKINLFLLCAICLNLFSCSNQHKKRHYHSFDHLQIIDTFSVPCFVDVPADLMSFHYSNDSTAYAVEMMMRDLTIYKRDEREGGFKTKRRLTHLKRLNAPIEFITQTSFDHKNRFIIGDLKSHRLNVYDDNLQLLSENPLRYSFPHLGSAYYLKAGTYKRPAGLFGDTLITGVLPQKESKVAAYFKENLFMSFLWQGDTLSFIQTFGLSIVDGSLYYHNYPMYTWGANKVWVLYPALDTLYTYSLNTGMPHRMPIGNKDFDPPAIWHSPGKESSEFVPKLNQYLNENFRYKGIVLDKQSGHLVLWYIRPGAEKAYQSHTTSTDYWYAIVLNKKGNILKYYKINTHQYFPLIFQTPKGLAIPKFTNNYGQKVRLHFDVFQL